MGAVLEVCPEDAVFVRKAVVRLALIRGIVQLAKAERLRRVRESQSVEQHDFMRSLQSPDLFPPYPPNPSGNGAVLWKEGDADGHVNGARAGTPPRGSLRSFAPDDPQALQKHKAAEKQDFRKELWTLQALQKHEPAEKQDLREELRALQAAVAALMREVGVGPKPETPQSEHDGSFSSQTSLVPSDEIHQ